MATKKVRYSKKEIRSLANKGPVLARVFFPHVGSVSGLLNARRYQDRNSDATQLVFLPFRNLHNIETFAYTVLIDSTQILELGNNSIDGLSTDVL